MYTFLPIAPCTFTVNGKHFDAKVNEPFSVDLKEAKIIASPSFRFRKYVRLITPLPKEEKVEKPVSVVPESSKIDEVKQFSEEPSLESKVEPEVTKIESEVSNDSPESENANVNKKRIRRKSSISVE